MFNKVATKHPKSSILASTLEGRCLLQHSINLCCHFQGTMTWTSRSLCSTTFLSAPTSTVYVLPLFDFPNCITLYLAGLISICLQSSQLFIWSICCCSLRQPSALCTSQKDMVLMWTRGNSVNKQYAHISLNAHDFLYDSVTIIIWTEPEKKIMSMKLISHHVKVINSLMIMHVINILYIHICKNGVHSSRI